VRNLLYSTEALGEAFRVKFSQQSSWIYSYRLYYKFARYHYANRS